MAFGKVGKARFQVGDGFGGQNLVDVPDGPLFDGKGLVGAGVLLPLDIVEQGAEKVQLRLFPEILAFVAFMVIRNESQLNITSSADSP